MLDVETLTVYVHSAGPNPLKVIIICEELGVPYKKIVVEDPKEEWFTKINPNGRLPAIVDPNLELTLWESGVIIEYLVDTYDVEGKLTAEDPKTKWHLRQFLHFQASGQGPYYGQAVWFHKCPEDIPLAKQRYIEQAVRVVEVLDDMLKGKEYLAAGKLTYADLSFVPWNHVLRSAPFFQDTVWKRYGLERKCPDFMAWHERMMARPSVKAVYGL
ncbi:putative Glutathione S-transferase [Seiridium cardinale]